jgi:hypothetical protein
LAERLPRSVHLRGDLFRRMIVSGQAEMALELSAEAHLQLQLRYELAVTAAKRYVEAGFTVVYQDIVIGAALADVCAALRSQRLAVVVLCPRPAVLAARDRERAKTGYPHLAAVEAFDHILRTETARIGFWLDNSDLSLEETVQQVWQNLARARV